MRCTDLINTHQGKRDTRQSSNEDRHKGETEHIYAVQKQNTSGMSDFLMGMGSSALKYSHHSTLQNEDLCTAGTVHTLAN